MDTVPYQPMNGAMMERTLHISWPCSLMPLDGILNSRGSAGSLSLPYGGERNYTDRFAKASECPNVDYLVDKVKELFPDYKGPM